MKYEKKKKRKPRVLSHSCSAVDLWTTLLTVIVQKMKKIYQIGLQHVLSAKMEGAGFMTYTAAGHQGMTEMFWLQVSGALMLFFFILYMSMVRGTLTQQSFQLNVNISLLLMTMLAC